mmetsp:Transcript_32738/g.92857  ORF Transcript_32738/g.92857 Transcript_32738/m.92857 type:complete len:154 (-) Transcript_32738:350-811(-)
MASALNTFAAVARPVAVAGRASPRLGRAVASPLGLRPLVTRRSPVVVRAEETPIDTEEIKAKAAATAEDLKAKWEATEEKPAAIALTVAGFVAVWAANGVVGAIDGLPIIGDLFELIGLLVTAWFVYRYLLFGPDRAELKTKVDAFVSKMKGN